MTKQYRGRIENWTIFGSTVMGHIYDEPFPRFSNSNWIQTSSVVKLDEEGKTLETQNSTYSLGEKLKS